MNPLLGTDQPQQEPSLLLANAQWIAVAPKILSRQAIAQPIACRRHQLDVMLLEADFLFQFPIQCLLGRLIATHAALRKLPSPAAGTTTEEYLPIVANQY